MDQRVKQLWIAALESGEYDQTAGYLQKIDTNGNKSYCCLGVLCELAIKDGVDIDYVDREVYGSYGRAISFLPPEVSGWAGLDDNGGTFHGDMIVYQESDEFSDETFDQYADSLVALNDGAKYTFNQIAGVIRDRF